MSQKSTRFFFYVGVLCLAALMPTSLGCAQDADSLRLRADGALNEGDYPEARRLFQSLLEESSDYSAADAYASTFEAVGEYGEGIAEMEGLLQASPAAAPLHCARARLLMAVGRYSEAEEAFASALQQQDDLWTCRAQLADLLNDTGRVREAQRILFPIYDAFQRGLLRTAPALSAAGRASAALAQFRDANEAFRTAHQIDPHAVPNLYAWAELFRQKYNEADARRTYGDALAVNPRHTPSLIGMARATPSFERQDELAEQALTINPNSVDALDLMASLRILDGMYDEAESIATRALAVNPNSVTSLAQLASVHYLKGDTSAFHEAEARALRVNPRPGAFYLTVAENATRRFRYPDAAELAARAIHADPSNLQAHAELGAALLRLGHREDARQHLAIAFENDPYNLFASNTLTFLDASSDFVVLESARFKLLIHPDERDVLGPLMLRIAEACFDSLSERYPYRPSGKILLEAYGDADDFAVRIAGVPHRGLLGVSFGDVVAVNTPAAASTDNYNWARTLWHEIAHTMAIGVSDFHVPRWFTEGLSVYEEQRARTEWGRDTELQFLKAYESDRLLPLDQLDRGFTRPEFPGQVLLSYYHASRIIEFIVELRGFDAISGILENLATGMSEEEAIEASTGLSRAELDRRFRDALEGRSRALAGVLDGLPDVFDREDADVDAESAAGARGSLFTQLQQGADHLEREDYSAAEAAFKKAISAYPEYVGPLNAYEGLAAVYRARNDADALEDVLARYVALAEFQVEAALELADIYTTREDHQRAIGMLIRSLHVDPYNPSVHERLASEYSNAGRYSEAVAHRQAVLALEPADRAGAYFELAQSLDDAGRAAEARRAVVQALEIAPGFRDAQEFLLEVVQ